MGGGKAENLVVKQLNFTEKAGVVMSRDHILVLNMHRILVGKVGQNKGTFGKIPLKFFVILRIFLCLPLTL